MRYMMRCRNVQKKLPAYQDRELKPREQEEVRKHLVSCQSCFELYAGFERVWRTLGKLEEIRPDPWFYRQLVRKIEEPRERSLMPTVERFFQLLRTPAVASILLAIGILTGTYLGNVLVQRDFFPFQPTHPPYSQEAL